MLSHKHSRYSVEIIIFVEMKTFDTQQTDIFEILCQTISEGIVIADSDRKIIASNHAVNSTFGYKDSELLGKQLDVLIPKNIHPGFQERFNHYFKQDQLVRLGVDKEVLALKKNGETIPIELSVNPFKTTDQEFIMILINDISARKNQEQQILGLNQKLSQLVDERTTELNQIIIELKEEIKKRKKAEFKMKAALDKEIELNELKTKFLSLVSHEFKTPLSIILSSATLAEKYVLPEHQEKREKHLNNIKLKVKTLNNILNDFLSIEKIHADKGTYKFDKFPLIRVINSVVYNANMISKENQKINYPENIDDLMVYFDEQILELSLNNLLNNSIKYSSEDSEIDIRVRTADDKIHISVTDNGIGISKKEQKFIFNPYFRAENALTQQGTGIGLNIVKEHLEKLQSSISFTSEEGKGSVFTISLPHKKEK